VEHAPMLPNYALCALAGTTWYMQFFFYSMGETQMGRYKFSSWTLHMASIIIFSTLWGVALREWTGVSSRTRCLVILAIAVLIASTMIVGYGNYLGTTPSAGRAAVARRCRALSDTSPHEIELGGKKRKVQTASAVLCYSRIFSSWRARLGMRTEDGAVRLASNNAKIMPKLLILSA
jgi:L-rhamnose-proton symport protein (RhaT)